MEADGAGVCLVMCSFEVNCLKVMCTSARSLQTEAELEIERERVIFPPVIAILHYRLLDPRGTVAPGDNQQQNQLICFRARSAGVKVDMFTSGKKSQYILEREERKEERNKKIKG